MKPKSNRLFPSAIIVVAATAATTSMSHAANGTWNAAANGNWSDGTKWTGGVPNATSETATFNQNWTGQTITVDGNYTVGSILATDTTAGGDPALLISGGVLILDNGLNKPVIQATTFGEFTRFKITTELQGVNGFEKTGDGYLDLTGSANTFSGNIKLNGGGGFVVINNDANLGNSANDIEVATTASATGFYNDASAGNFTLNSGRTITTTGTGDFWVKNKFGANMTIAGKISGTARLRKNDSGALTLTGANDYTGGTFIQGGTLVLSGGNNRLLNTSTVTFGSGATLDVGATTQTLSSIVGSGSDTVTGSYTVNGVGGKLLVNGNVQYTVSGSVGTLVNMAGLSEFEYNSSTKNFVVQPTSIAGSPGTASTAELRLAANGIGKNTITAAAVTIGTAASGGADNLGTLRLGTENTINSGTIQIGGFNGRGIINFNTGLTTPTLKLRGVNGSSAMTNLNLGLTSSTARAGTGILDLTGGSLDAVITNLTIGNNTTSLTDNSALTMPAGTVVVTNLKIGTVSGMGTPNGTLNNAFNQGGGTVTATTLTFGENTNTNPTPQTPIFNASYNLNGGTLFAQTIGGGAGTFNTTTSNRTLSINGGTLRNLNASTDLTVTGVDSTAGGQLKVVLGASGGTFEADASRTITIGSNAVVSGGALTKTGSGTLTLTSANTYTGGTFLAGGTLALSGGANRLLNTSTVTFNAASTLDVGSTSQTLGGLVLLGNGTTNTISGAGGTLILNVGDTTWNTTANGTTVDMSGLSNFTFNRTAGNLQLNANGLNVVNTVNLAKAGTNTINATNVRFGGGANVVGQDVLVGLGQNNNINASGEFVIGYFNGNGNVSFQSGLTNPVLTVRGTGGSGATPLMTVGSTNSGTQSSTGILNLTGGSLDVIATEFNVGRHWANTAGAGTSATGTVTMPAGTVVATTLNLAAKTNSTGTPTVTGTFNQGGGTVTANTVNLGNNANTDSPNLIANYNLTGGTLYATTIQGSGATYGGSTVRNLTINGGTLRNLAGGDLSVNGLAATATGRINVIAGASGATFNADANRTITLGANTVLSGGSSNAITKSSDGTLLINGTSSGYTGTLSVNAGTLGGATSLGGNLTVGASGKLAPGASTGTIGTIATKGATWTAGSIWEFDLSAGTPGSSDLLSIDGNFTKAGTGTYQFNFMDSSPTVWGATYTLVSWTGTTDFLLSNFSYTNLGGAYDLQPGTGFSFGVDGKSLVFTAVPEPTSALAGLLLGAGLLRRRRK